MEMVCFGHLVEREQSANPTPRQECLREGLAQLNSPAETE